MVNSECAVLEDVSSVEDSNFLFRSKMVLIPLLFISTLLASVSPWYISRLPRAVMLLSLVCGLSGGVILGAAFSHLLPNALDSWSTYFCLYSADASNVPYSSAVQSYPFASLIGIFTLLLLQTIDSVIIRGGMEGSEHQHDHQRLDGGGDVGHNHMVPVLPACSSPTAEAELANLSPSRLAVVNLALVRPHTRIDAPNSFSVVSQHDSLDEEELVVDEVDRSHRFSSDSKHVAVPTSSDDASIDHSFSVRHSDESIDQLRGGRRAVSQAYIFFVALSLHSVFDGLSIGSESTANGFYSLLFAVLSHKLLDGLALGISIFFAGFTQWRTGLALSFCAGMTPLGIAVGYLSTNSYSSSTPAVLARAIVLSLSFGSFLFISVVELIPAALADRKFLWRKMAIISSGWGIMALIAIWV